MRKPLILSFLVFAAWIFSSCAGGEIKTSPFGGESGIRTTIVVGRIIIDPQPEAGQTGFLSGGDDGQARLFLDTVLKIGADIDDDTWKKWPVMVGGLENEPFYYGIPNRRYYAVMAGYMLARSGGYELIKFPVSFTLDIQPGDRAIYIGTIKFTRDPFYHTKKIEVYDEYAKVMPEFTAHYGRGIKLKKALAKILNKVSDEE
jgi:hypothetical protein